MVFIGMTILHEYWRRYWTTGRTMLLTLLRISVEKQNRRSSLLMLIQYWIESSHQPRLHSQKFRWNYLRWDAHGEFCILSTLLTSAIYW